MTRERLWTKSFVIISLVNFLLALNFWLLLTVVAKFATDRFGASPAVAGFAASIFIIGAVVGRMMCGRWVHNIGQNRMIYFGMVFSLLMTLAYFAVSNIALLMLVRILHGVAFGVTHIAAATIVAGVVPKARYGEGIGYFTLGQILATAIGPFIGLPLIQQGDFAAIITACSIAIGAALLLIPLLTVPDLELTQAQMGESKGLRLTGFVDRAAVPIALVSLVIYFCYANVISFLALFAEEVDLTRPAGNFFLVCAVAMFVTRPFVGRRFDAKGANAVMYPSLPIFALGLALFSQARGGFVLLLAAVIIGLGFGAVQSSGMTIAVKTSEPHRQGLAASTFYTFGDVGAGIGPLLCGLAVPFIGYRGTFLAVAAVAAAGLALYWGTIGRTAGRQPG